jgi:hypothetical protein
MAIINDSDGDDALSQDNIVIVSSEPPIDWTVLGDLTSIEIVFSNTANDDQPEINNPNLDSDGAVNNEIDDDDTFFPEEEIMLRFGSHDSFGFGLNCSC